MTYIIPGDSVAERKTTKESINELFEHRNIRIEVVIGTDVSKILSLNQYDDEERETIKQRLLSLNPVLFKITPDFRRQTLTVECRGNANLEDIQTSKDQA